VKVFLVEDSPLLRERLEALLAAIPGASVVGHAGDAETAIRGILDAVPDVVVLDIQLERSSGFDVMRALRERAPQVEFYVLTNFANDGYRKAAERLGARGFFDKTNDIPQLREALAAREHRSHRQAE
jgi:two-component system response regulator DevR